MALVEGGHRVVVGVASDAGAEAEDFVVEEEVGFSGGELVAGELDGGGAAGAVGGAADEGVGVSGGGAAEDLVHVAVPGLFGGGAGEFLPVPGGEDVEVFGAGEVEEGVAVA